MVTDLLPSVLAAAMNPEVSQAARTVLNEVSGDAPRHMRGIVSDQLGYLRLRHITWLCEKVRRIVGPDVRLRPVALRTLLPLLEAGSLEEDEEMRERWAALLASAGTEPDAVPPSFVQILRELSPEEARLLEAIADGKFSFDDPAPREPERTPGAIFVQMRVPWFMDLDSPDPDTPEGRIVAALDERDPRLRMRLANLDRIGLVVCSPHGEETPIEGVSWDLSAFGRSFVAACRARRESPT